MPRGSRSTDATAAALLEPLDAPDSASASASSPHRPRVLIIEDDLTSASALRSILTRKGCEVRTAANLADGMRLLDARPDYVVLDLILPDGSGLEILRRLRAEQSPIKVVVTTAVRDPERVREIHALRPHQLLRKPIDLIDLLRAIGMM
jgi:CheY-like chemotaxis protein